MWAERRENGRNILAMTGIAPIGMLTDSFSNGRPWDAFLFLFRTKNQFPILQWFAAIRDNSWIWFKYHAGQKRFVTQ
jgi:hypothetical protein